ncbi:hypothetical protein Acr_29g0009560 [Actinidia rufa]|uniref:Uncharacterized protein n=1 Tax=Actinidia rufa TaxID=165716 RepID=A0A7J0HGC6_9ERIC|nr:hypothetical protein Acr_29g0009560 [Actinidia rufa]
MLSLTVTPSIQTPPPLRFSLSRRLSPPAGTKSTTTGTESTLIRLLSLFHPPNPPPSPPLPPLPTAGTLHFISAYKTESPSPSSTTALSVPVRKKSVWIRRFSGSTVGLRGSTMGSCRFYTPTELKGLIGPFLSPVDGSTCSLDWSDPDFKTMI